MFTAIDIHKFTIDNIIDHNIGYYILYITFTFFAYTLSLLIMGINNASNFTFYVAYGCISLDVLYIFIRGIKIWKKLRAEKIVLSKLHITLNFCSDLLHCIGLIITLFMGIPFMAIYFFYFGKILSKKYFKIYPHFTGPITYEIYITEYNKCLETLNEINIDIDNASMYSTYVPPNNYISDDCIICIQPMLSTEALITLRCDHFFHKICIDQWLIQKLECPVCRRIVLS